MMLIFVCEIIYLNVPSDYANSDLNDENRRKCAPLDCYCYLNLCSVDEKISVDEKHLSMIDVRDLVLCDVVLVYDLFVAHTCFDGNIFAMVDGTVWTWVMMCQQTLASAVTVKMWNETRKVSKCQNQF